MDEYDAKVLELAEKHDAFMPRQILDIVKGWKEPVPLDEADALIESMRHMYPSCFKPEIIHECDIPIEVRDRLKQECYAIKAFEMAEKHDAFYAPQMVNIAKSQDVPIGELDLWMQAMRVWQPCLFKANIVGFVGQDDPVDLREYMKKLLAKELLAREKHDAEVKRQGALAERGTVGEEP